MIIAAIFSDLFIIFKMKNIKAFKTTRMFKKIFLIMALMAPMTGSTVQAGSGNPHPNSLRIIPTVVYGLINVGVGISYERQITKNGDIGLYLPIYYGKKEVPTGGVEPTDFLENGATSILLNPGVKFYILKKKRVTLAIGPSVFTSIGEGIHIQKRGPTTDYHEFEINSLKAGLMANVHVQLNASPRFFIGFDVGLGPSMINQYRYKENNQLRKESVEAYPLANFHLGFRF
jgi:hypothetical protein